MAVFRNPELDVGGRRLDYPRIVIADHHIPTRVGVRLALEHDGFVVAAEESAAPTAVAAALRDPPDVCLLDVDVPCGRIEAAEAITSQLPETQLVMLGEAAKDEDV
jgi:DNA-binding NarL/FixJ family response regulator